MTRRRCRSGPLDGRIKKFGPHALAQVLGQLVEHRQGDSGLIFRDDKWFLVATCEVVEVEPFEPRDWIGVDRGINKSSPRFSTGLLGE
ncbi:hypothetical protein ACWDKQ_22860 [Saccharopolyspora sp. NPDC000995]